MRGLLEQTDEGNINTMLSDTEKSNKLEEAYSIIGNLDEVNRTEWLDKAIEQLELLKFKREELPL
jgi:hypothetical protein